MKTKKGFIDLHCDTLTDCGYSEVGNLDTLNDPNRVLSLSKIPKGTQWAQLFALFIPDEKRGVQAIRHFEENCRSFYRQMEKFSDMVAPCKSFEELQSIFDSNRFAAILSVEGGSALAGDLARVQVLAELGVRALTLVWNGENEIGSGAKTEKGLTAFGRAVIPELERHNIILDVSHLNDNGFAELLEIAQKPFVATHSNARALASHKRNLTDEQIQAIVRVGGLIGLNFYTAFLRDDHNVQSLEDVYRHASHMLDLGAESCVALGSDYDGAQLPECLNSGEKILTICDYFVSRGMEERVAENIMFGNAYQFFKRNLR